MFADTNNDQSIAIRPAVLKRRRDNESEALHRALLDLGLTDHEAQCYSTICGGGRFSAYEVSNRIGLARPNTYAALKSLVARGFVAATGDSPTTYHAFDPDQIFIMVEQRITEICRETAGELELRFRGSKNAADWILEGEDAVEQSVRSSLADARKVIWIKATATQIDKFADALKSAADAGVRIMLIHFDKLPEATLDSPNVRKIPHEGNAHGCSPANRELFSMLVDARHATITAYWDGAVAYRIVSPLVLTMMQAFFCDEVRLARAMERHGALIGKAFGEGLKKLRQTYRPDNMENARPSGTRSTSFFTRSQVTDQDRFIKRPEALEERLRWFGMTDTEARAYLALIDMSQSGTVAQIARQTSISKSNIHGALRALEQKQVVQATGSKPVSYQPRAVDELLDTIRSRILRSCRIASEEDPQSGTADTISGNPVSGWSC